MVSTWELGKDIRELFRETWLAKIKGPRWAIGMNSNVYRLALRDNCKIKAEIHSVKYIMNQKPETGARLEVMGFGIGSWVRIQACHLLAVRQWLSD